MAKYGVFESTNMKSTKGAERIYDAVATVDIENGTFGYLNGRDDDGVVYKFATGTSAGKPVVVVDQPAWNYDESKRINQRRDNFVITAGTKFRVRVVALNDEFGINDVCATSTSKALLKKDAFLTIDTNGKLVAKAATTADATFEAVVLRERISGNTVVTANANTYGYSDKIYECGVTVLK